MSFKMPVITAVSSRIVVEYRVSAGMSDREPASTMSRAFFVSLLFFFTGTHEDYHQLGDHSDKLSYPRMEKIVRSAYRVLEPIADGAHTPSFVFHLNWLGAEVREGKLVNLDPDGRGAQAGLVDGDAIVGLGEALTPVDRPGAALDAIEPGTQATVWVKRAGGSLPIVVTRAKTGYLGIYPAGVSDEQRAAAGSSRQQQAAAGSSRQQQARSGTMSSLSRSYGGPRSAT